MSANQKHQFDNSVQARPDTVTDIIGLDVYSKSGVYIGEVDDVRLNFSQKASTGIALTNINPELDKVKDSSSSEGIVIPYNWIQSIHDIIITIDIIRRLNYVD